MSRRTRGLAASMLAMSVMLASMPAWAETGTRTWRFLHDPDSGLVTKEVAEPDSPQLRLEVSYVYDAYGNRTAVTLSSPATGDAAIAARTTTATFDSKGRFATESANALNHSETRVYDARFGVVTSHTGPNGLTTSWQYDAFGRKTLEIRADGTQTKWEYRYCGGVQPCPDHAKYLVKVTPLASDGTTLNGPIAITYFDGLGREVRSTTQGFDGTTIIVDAQYDSLGRLTHRSRPYFPSDAPAWIVRRYDALGRLTRETQPDNSVTKFTYAGLVTTITDPLNRTRTETRNSQGHVVSVEDAMGGTTAFRYGPFDTLTRSTDVAGNIATMEYDVRGRKVAMADPNAGSWTYGYDVLDQLVRQTDAKSQVTTFTYDMLGRMTGRTEPGLTSSWTWDTAVKGIGKLAATSASNGYQRQHSYDALSRPWQTAITVDGTVATTTTTYDSNSRIDTVTYPSGFAVRHVYAVRGYLKEVRNAATNALYWRVGAMSADLQLTSFSHGNDVATTQTFNANTGRLTSIHAGTNATVASFTYSWDRVGNLQWRKDANENVEEVFQYDALNRLTQAAIEGGPTRTYQYNAVGNLTFKSDVGTYTYPAAGSPRPHAVSSISGTLTTSFTYDANGNLLGGAGRTLSWTSFDMPATITRGSHALAFDYDTDHARIRQAAADGTTLYLDDPASGVRVEKFTAAGSGAVRWSNYIQAADGLVAVVFEEASGATQTRYLHKDHLGSIAVITDAAGAVVERLAYDAWGKRRFPDGADDPGDTISSLTPFGFTEHRHLQAVALVHMEGRVYDPCVGRFTSADPWVADPASSQSFNRYSYVRNNPTSRIDPSGYQDGAAWGGIGTWSWNLPPPAVPSGATPLPVIVVTPDGDLPGNLGWSWGMSDSAARVLGGPFVAPSWGVPYYTPGVPYFTPPSVSGPSTWEPGPGLAPGITSPTDPGIPGKWPQSPEAAARELSFWIHGTLTAASFAPSVVGSIASAVDTVVYGIEGDWIGVQIGLASTVVGAVSSAGIVKVGLTAAKQASVGSRLTRGTAGRFSDLAARASKGDKLTPNHMPQVAAGFTNRAEGGALMLPEAEHILTRTYGLKGALTARQEAGMAFRDVLARDIRDVRSIGGSQYNQGLWDLMDYYRTNFPELMQKR